MPSHDPTKLAKSRLVLLAGDDAHARWKLTAALVEAAEGGDETMVARPGERTLAEIVAEATTPPFFSPRRVVVVHAVETRDPDSAPGGAAGLAAALKSLPETALVLLVPGESGAVADEADEDSPRRKSFGAAWRKLVAEAGGTTVKLEADRAALPGTLRAAAAAAGKELPAALAQELAEMVGGDPALAENEIAKVVAYVGQRDRIQRDDLQAVVVATQEYNVFVLVDNVFAGSVGQAVRQFHRLVAGSRDFKSEVFPRLVPTLHARLRLVRQARALLDAGEQPTQPGADAKGWLPESSIATERDWLARKALASARRLTAGQVVRMTDVLAGLDAGLKGIVPSAGDEGTVEAAIVELATIAGSK